jgi:hypothetical protein
LIDWQGHDRTGFTHQCLFRQTAQDDFHRFHYASNLPTKQRPVTIECYFDRSTTV